MLLLNPLQALRQQLKISSVRMKRDYGKKASCALYQLWDLYITGFPHHHLQASRDVHWTLQQVFWRVLKISTVITCRLVCVYALLLFFFVMHRR